MTFTAGLGFLPEGALKNWLGYHAFLTSFRMIARAISAVICYHNPENRPKSDGICVANHTSPIDCAILSCDNVYAFVSFFSFFLFELLGSSPLGVWESDFDMDCSSIFLLPERINDKTF